MTIETTTTYTPMIRQTFDPYLLMNTLQRMNKLLNDKIIPLAEKKLRNLHGKKREFENLMKEWEEVYGRKTVEEADYQEDYKKKIAERPSISIASGTIRLKRIRTE